MNTSAEAIKLLQQALAQAQDAAKVIDNLIVAHDYQDVASLVAKASAELISSTMLLLQSDPDAALDALERADDLLDAVYDIIDAETDEE
ncbi:hypothetical protein FBR02_15445 [Anaerolineae bacterium CFX9]|nr:hypothetical protein [Anaerolineae bacterium CFX9]